MSDPRSEVRSSIVGENVEGSVTVSPTTTSENSETENTHHHPCWGGGMTDYCPSSGCKHTRVVVPNMALLDSPVWPLQKLWDSLLKEQLTGHLQRQDARSLQEEAYAVSLITLYDAMSPVGKIRVPRDAMRRGWLSSFPVTYRESLCFLSIELWEGFSGWKSDPQRSH